ncbi:MAG: hypothetical protein ACODAE_05585 [Gemmatimonadota bacterium]
MRSDRNAARRRGRAEPRALAGSPAPAAAVCVRVRAAASGVAALALALLLLLLPPGAHHTAAQEPATAEDPGARESTVTEVFFGVEVPAAAAAGGPAGGAVVDARYGVAVRAGTDTVRLRTIVFADSRPSRVEAWVHGEPASVSPGGTQGRDLTFLLEVPRTVPRDRRLVVRLRYAVTRPGLVDGDRFDVVVPLILPEAPPSDAPERLFTGEVRLPSEWTVVEAFPTVPRSTRTNGDGATATHTFDLQAVPAMLRWRGRLGDPPAISLDRAVDIATLGAFLCILVFGYGWLRREGGIDG